MEVYIIDYTFLTIQRGLSATRAKNSGPHFLNVEKKPHIIFSKTCQVICFELLYQGGLNSSISVKVLNGLGKEKETLYLSALYRAV